MREREREWLEEEDNRIQEEWSLLSSCYLQVTCDYLPTLPKVRNTVLYYNKSVPFCWCYWFHSIDTTDTVQLVPFCWHYWYL